MFTSYYNTQGPKSNKTLNIYNSNLFWSNTIMLCILYFNSIKNTDSKKRGPLDSYSVFHCKVRLLTCLKMASVQAEICSIHVKLTIWIKLNLCCIILNKCGLFIWEYSVNLWLLRLCMYILELSETLYVEFICICDYKFLWEVRLLLTTF